MRLRSGSQLISQTRSALDKQLVPIPGGRPVLHYLTFTLRRIWILSAPLRSDRAAVGLAIIQQCPGNSGLIEFVDGAWFSFGGGPKLTPTGERVARYHAYPTAEIVTEESS